MKTKALAVAFLLSVTGGDARAEPAAPATPEAQASALTSAAGTAEPLRVGAWSGAYGASVNEIVFKPFTSRTGIEVVEAPYAGGAAELSAAPFDVADFTGEDAAEACAAGLLTEIDQKSLAAGADQSPAESDFLAKLPCAAASTLTAEVLIYATGAKAARTPQHVTDVFDLAAFPGKRGLKRDAIGTLELALLSDGVLPKDVYDALSTQEGIARAFAKLDAIKHEIVWWEKGEVPATLVARGEVVMSTAYNTRAYAAMVSGAEIGAAWNKALIYVNGWGVLKSARDQRAALELVKFATDSARLAQIGEAMPYGPARRSALQGISPEMRAISPSAPEHLERAFVIDVEFWAKNGLGMRNRFAFWLEESAKPAREASLSATPVEAQSSAPVTPQP